MVKNVTSINIAKIKFDETQILTAKNIDIELENWRSLKTNSEKMISELNNRKDKIQVEISENRKNPERIATSKGQNLQNLENIKKRNDEIESELIEAEKKFFKTQKTSETKFCCLHF